MNEWRNEYAWMRKTPRHGLQYAGSLTVLLTLVSDLRLPLLRVAVPLSASLWQLLRWRPRGPSVEVSCAAPSVDRILTGGHVNGDFSFYFLCAQLPVQ
eukprot:940185-Pleurochrysis_carterae.AAC.1